MPQRRISPNALQDLLNAIEQEENTEEFEGATDCREGCVVELDGWCPHGYYSATATLLMEAI